MKVGACEKKILSHLWLAGRIERNKPMKTLNIRNAIKKVWVRLVLYFGAIAISSVLSGLLQTLGVSEAVWICLMVPSTGLLMGSPIYLAAELIQYIKHKDAQRKARTLYVQGLSSTVKNCSNCGRAVSREAQAGERCPHCGVHWSYESGVRPKKRCGNCKKDVQYTAKVGQRCPHCSALWEEVSGLY